MSTHQVIEGTFHAPEKAKAAVLTPMELIDRAITGGAQVEVLEKLFALQERYEASQAKKAFNNAIADAKAKIKPIVKNRKVDFTSQKGRTNYEYEDLAAIAEAVDPILASHGLSYRHRSQQDGTKLSVTCIISHRDGYFEETTLTAENDNSGNKNSIQAIGSAATFLQRYTLKLALGLAATKDDDGKKADAPTTISEKQLTELISLADDLNADKARFCEFFNIESFADILSKDFHKAKNALLAKGKVKK
jgi:hypothetical protein